MLRLNRIALSGNFAKSVYEADQEIVGRNFRIRVILVLDQIRECFPDRGKYLRLKIPSIIVIK